MHACSVYKNCKLEYNYNMIIHLLTMRKITTIRHGVPSAPLGNGDYFGIYLVCTIFAIAVSSVIFLIGLDMAATKTRVVAPGLITKYTMGSGKTRNHAYVTVRYLSNGTWYTVQASASIKMDSACPRIVTNKIKPIYLNTIDYPMMLETRTYVSGLITFCQD